MKGSNTANLLREQIRRLERAVDAEAKARAAKDRKAEDEAQREREGAWFNIDRYIDELDLMDS